MLENKTTVIFDFDFTLGDSSGGVIRSVTYALDEMGLPPVDNRTVLQAIGLSLPETYRAITGEKNSWAEERFTELFIKKARSAIRDATTLLPGAEETLARLSRLHVLGIVTSKLHRTIAEIVKLYGLEKYIAAVIGADDSSELKPSPKPLYAFMQAIRMENTPENRSKLLYVGDSVVDALAAQSAGIDFVGVLTGFTDEATFRETGAASVVASVAEIGAEPGAEPG